MRINLTELPSWETLNGCERYYAGYIARRFEETSAVHKWRPGCVHQVFFHWQALEPRDSRLWHYAADSLLCALTHTEPITVLRALLQAAAYLGTLEGLSVIAGDLCDARRTAQHRLEGMLS